MPDPTIDAEALSARIRAEAVALGFQRFGISGIALDEDCPVLNTPLRQLNELFSTLRAIVVAVRREGRLCAPEPGDQLFAGDQIHVFTHDVDANRTLDIFGKSTRKMERVIIVGGGNVGLAVARALEARTDRMRVKVIEHPDKDGAYAPATDVIASACTGPI